MPPAVARNKRISWWVVTAVLAAGGLALILFSAASLTSHYRVPAPALQVERGSIRWLLPGRIHTLGPKKYLVSRKEVIFRAYLTYPKEISIGTGFQIALESAIETVRENPPSDVPLALDPIFASLNRDYHEFELELPGVTVSPAGANRVSVDGKVRWQVAPIRDPGTYTGYIREKGGGSIAIRGGEYVVQWSNPGELELRVVAVRPFGIADKVESLLVGLLGSILTFPALVMLYQLIRRRRRAPSKR